MEQFRDLTHLTPDTSPTPDEIVMLLEEGDEPIGEDEINGLAGVPPDALLRLLRAILPHSMNPDGSAYWSGAILKLAALAWSIDPNVRCHSQDAIAKALGKTRASISNYVTQLRDFGGLDCRGGMSQRARDGFSKQKSEIWKKRRHAV